VKRALRFLLPAAVALAATVALFGNTMLGAMGAFLVRAEAPRQAGIAVVLAGDATGGRILKAAELVRAGYVPRALVSGPPGFYGHYECDLAIPFAVQRGYPEAYFAHFENEALSTGEEARLVAAELRRLGVRDALIVTSDYHTRRAGRAFRQVAPDLNFTVVASADDHFTPDGWWRDREGRKTWLIETLKTAAYWLGL
jgi:uncharacterized SAM-binding protein YcdF (DUF218 family)